MILFSADAKIWKILCFIFFEKWLLTLKFEISKSRGIICQSDISLYCKVLWSISGLIRKWRRNVQFSCRIALYSFNFWFVFGWYAHDCSIDFWLWTDYLRNYVLSIYFLKYPRIICHPDIKTFFVIVHFLNKENKRKLSLKTRALWLIPKVIYSKWYKVFAYLLPQ